MHRRFPAHPIEGRHSSMPSKGSLDTAAGRPAGRASSLTGTADLTAFQLPVRPVRSRGSGCGCYLLELSGSPCCVKLGFRLGNRRNYRRLLQLSPAPLRMIGRGLNGRQGAVIFSSMWCYMSGIIGTLPCFLLLAANRPRRLVSVDARHSF